MSTSMFLRLWTRAPRTAIQSCAMLPRCGFPRVSKHSLYSNQELYHHGPGGTDTAAAVPLGRPSLGSLLQRSETTVPVPVAKVNTEADDEPRCEPLPCVHRQAGHRVQARERTSNGNQRQSRHAEWAGPIGIGAAEHQNAHTDDRKCRQRADVGEVVNFVFVQ